MSIIIYSAVWSIAFLLLVGVHFVILVLLCQSQKLSKCFLFSWFLSNNVDCWLSQGLVQKVVYMGTAGLQLQATGRYCRIVFWRIWSRLKATRRDAPLSGFELLLTGAFCSQSRGLNFLMLLWIFWWNWWFKRVSRFLFPHSFLTKTNISRGK